MNETRCFDCLEDFGDLPKFVVLKQVRDVVIPTDAMEPPSFFQSMACDAVTICAHCAGWYGDDAMRMA